MLDWIPVFAEKATAFIPRFAKVAPTDRMVKWSRCGEATVHGPGLVWYWPLVTEVQQNDVRWQSMVTSVQTVTLSDGTSVSARTLTRWKPTDLLSAVNSECDYMDTVAETAQGVLVNVLSSVDRSFLQQAKALSTALCLELQSELRPIGIKVQRCTFTELCVSPAFRIINDQ